MAQVSEPLSTGAGSQRRWVMPVGIGVVGLIVVSYLVDTTTDPAVSVLGDSVSRIAAAVIGAGGLVGSLVSWRTSPYGQVRRVTMTALGAGASLLLWYLYLTDGSVRATFRSIAVAVAVSAAIFVAANKWFDASLKDWRRFAALTGVVVGAAVTTLLVGNRAIGLFVADGDLSWVLIPLIALLAGAWGVGLSVTNAGSRKLVTGGVAGAIVGLVPGLFFRTGSLPDLEIVPLLASTVAVAVLGGLLAQLRQRPPLHGALTGASLGWLIGAFGIPDLGPGTIVEAILGTTILGLLIGLRLGLAPDQTIGRRLELDRQARVVIFLGPALLFISATLVIPTIRTMWLSLLDRTSQEFVGLGQYRAAFTDPNFFNMSRWAGAFSGTEFVVFAVTLLAGLAIMLVMRYQVDRYYPPRLLAATASAGALVIVATLSRLGRGDDITVATPLTFLGIALTAATVVLLALYLKANPGNSGLSGSSGGALTLAAIFLSLALFTHLRGTLFNNLWWVFTVTVVITGVGLAVAAISDGTKGESIAKSLIFMPMAVSFVGAAIIWRFMYIARPPVQDQTGVLNAVWVWLGKLANSSYAVPVAVVLFLAAAALVTLAVRGFTVGMKSLGWSSVLSAIPVAWLGLLIWTGDIGGATVGSSGDIIAEPILFLSGTAQVGAYNNLFVMLPFIWIYTGFAMVIFSAAIKSVPSDLIDAAAVDGATRSQKFWRVIVPQIAPTIGVVITTVIVVVMKVFDIVKVMTGGNFGTQVLANEMWEQAFTARNRGLGSAIAVMLFISVLPIMFANIRRMQKEFH